jgi:single-strand DNA-binding protein
LPGFTINQVTLSGNHTRDPEARTTPGGLDLCKCRIAFNERRKNQSTGDWEDKANYINVTIFGGMGAWIASNQRKGDSIVVAGRLSWHEWDTDNGKREAIEVIADSVATPREGKGGGGGDDLSRYDSGTDIPVDSGDLPEPGANAMAGTPGGDSDDIPF